MCFFIMMHVFLSGEVFLYAVLYVFTTEIKFYLDYFFLRVEILLTTTGFLFTTVIITFCPL